MRFSSEEVGRPVAACWAVPSSRCHSGSMRTEPLSQDRRQLFIGGEWRPASGGGRFDVIDPADGSVLTDVADGTVDDARAALDAAVEAQEGWAATPPRERGE